MLDANVTRRMTARVGEVASGDSQRSLMLH